MHGIEHYYSEDLETLYRIVGEIDSRVSEGERRVFKDIAINGKNYLKSIEGQLYNKVCIEWNCCERLSNTDYSDDIELIAAIADAIASVTIGFPPALIATILVKKGLRQFCRCC